MLVTLPFTLLLLDYWPLQRITLPLRSSPGTIVRLVQEKIPLFAMSLASCVVTFVAQRAGGAVQPLDVLPFSERLANAALAYVSYVAKAFWPASLSTFYPHSHTGILAWPVAESLLLLAATTALALRLASSAPYLLFGWLWYIGTLVPAIGLVQVGAQAMADRYTYVPLVGIFMAIAWGFAELTRGRRAGRYLVAAAAAASIVAMGAVTRIQVSHWANSTSLFEHALEVTSDNWLAHAYLASALAGRGEVEQAITHYKEALRINPTLPQTHNDLGILLARQGRAVEAIEQYNEALRLGSNFADAHVNLGVAFDKLGRRSEAIEQFREALRLAPDSVTAHLNLGKMLAGAGQIDAAIEQYNQVLLLRPDNVDARTNLRRAEESLGRQP